jgi:hypothetical protein
LDARCAHRKWATARQTWDGPGFFGTVDMPNLYSNEKLNMMTRGTTVDIKTAAQ